MRKSVCTANHCQTALDERIQFMYIPFNIKDEARSGIGVGPLFRILLEKKKNNKKRKQLNSVHIITKNKKDHSEISL